MWKIDDVVGLRCLEAAKSIVGHKGDVQQTTPSASSDMGSDNLTYGDHIPCSLQLSNLAVHIMAL